MQYPVTVTVYSRNFASALEKKLFSIGLHYATSRHVLPSQMQPSAMTGSARNRLHYPVTSAVHS